MLIVVACSRSLGPADLDAALADSPWGLAVVSRLAVVVPLSAVAEGWAERRGWPSLAIRPNLPAHGIAARPLAIERACRLAAEGGGGLLACWYGGEIETRAVVVAAHRWRLRCVVRAHDPDPECCRKCGEPRTKVRAGSPEEEECRP